MNIELCQTYAMFSKKLLMLNFVVPTFIHIVRTTGLECDGTRKSERIKGAPMKSIYLLPGNQANLVWTWCIAVNSSITGIAIYRSSQRNPKQMNHVLTMDLSKNLYYKKDNSRYELSSILNETKFQERTVFVINNVSKEDSGAYSLHVRREGTRDLQSEVNVIVKTTGTEPTKALRLTMPADEGTNTVSINNTFLETGQQKVKNVHSPAILILVTVISLVFVALVVGVVVVFKKRSGRIRIGPPLLMTNKSYFDRRARKSSFEAV